MESLSPVLAKRLKELREKKGLTLAALSKALMEQYGIQISKESLTNYEVTDSFHTKARKNEGMSVKYLRCLADFYSVSSDYLLGLTDIPNADPNTQTVHKFIGLSGEAIDFLRLSHRKNPIYLRNDAISFLLENERFQLLLDMIIGFGTSRGKKIPYDVVSNGVAPIVTDTDVFRSKAIDLFSSILLDSKGVFPENEVERGFYGFCCHQYENGVSLDSIKSLFEQHGLTFDQNLIGIGEEE